MFEKIFTVSCVFDNFLILTFGAHNLMSNVDRSAPYFVEVFSKFSCICWSAVFFGGEFGFDHLPLLFYRLSVACCLNGARACLPC